jgi:fumarate reductase subunit C
MTEYTGFRQRLYRQQMPLLWWLRRRSYLVFVVRELTSVFVAWAVVYTLLLIRAVAAGEQPYRQFLAWSAQPWVVAVNAVALGFVVFHAVTWFGVAPQAMVVRLRGRRLPGRWITALNYALWAAVSAVVAWLVVR